MKRSCDPNIWSGLGASTVAHVVQPPNIWSGLGASTVAHVVQPAAPESTRQCRRSGSI
jgi:hypothetical protein